jgi:hypothetical protein
MVVFCLAILASLCVHLPVYTALGTLADVLLHTPSAPPTQVEFELAALDDPAKVAEKEPAAPDKPTERVVPKPNEAKHDAPKPKLEPKPRAQADAQKPAPKPLQILPTPAAPPPPPPPPPPDLQNKLAVTQKSDDPNVPPPENSRFIAEDNRRVAEETIASITNLDVDQPDPTLQPSKSKATDKEGNDQDELPADLRDVHGEDKRAPTPKEATVKPVAPSHDSQGRELAPAVPRAPSVGGAEGTTRDKAAVAAGSELVGGDEQVVVIEDGMGTIRVRRAMPGHGPGNAGGEAQRGAANEQRAQRAGARRGAGTSLSLSWSQFEDTFGSAQLKEQRDAYLEQRRSKVQGGSHEREWKQFRAAIENYVSQVKPGNQTALNTAASPFAAYLSEVHRRIHREFSDRFIRDLPLVAGPFADQSLFTQLEIVINGDGTIYRVGVVQSSGFLPFDYGAWNSVMRGAPYPEAPKKILSGDGRVYMHWGFYRNERLCGTFNADPYILPNPGGSPAPTPGPMHDNGGGGGGGGDGPKFGSAAPVREPRPVLRVAAEHAWLR